MQFFIDFPNLIKLTINLFHNKSIKSSVFGLIISLDIKEFVIEF